MKRFAPLITLATGYVALGLLLRALLWWALGRPQQVSAAALGWMLPAGALADAVQSLYLLAPLTLFLWAMPDKWYRTTNMRALVLTGSFLWIFGAVFLLAVEYFFFEEFDARLSLVAVDYLMYPSEVVGDIWTSYPVIKVLLLAALASALSVYALRHRLHQGTAEPSTRLGERSPAFAAFATVLIVCAFAFETHNLTRSSNRIANEIAANGGSSFFRALRTNELDYHAYYASHEPRKNLDALVAQLSQDRGKFTRLSEGRVDRVFAGNPLGLGRLNVVVVASESFGAEFSKLYGSKRNWTPEFDAFARQGVWFRHMYASGTRTVRGLEAIVTSLPPIPSVSVVRRPGNEGMANWGSVMREHGYEASFLYGGYGYFDNMNYFFAHNGFDVRDRRDIPDSVRFENVWGVADEDLFDSALNYYDTLAQAAKPFFSVIMTTSNHKPFTFRAGVPGVKPAGGGRESGVRYADFAQGRFLREARKRPWFNNTLFVVVADHGARVYGRQEIPLRSYEIPMLLYAPKHLRPGRVDALTTQIDIAPTVLGLLGMPYHAPFFGTDVLQASAAQQRVAFFSHNHDVALYRNGELAILGLGKSIQNLHYDVASDSYRRAPLDQPLNDLAVAYYQTAFELFDTRRYN